MTLADSHVKALLKEGAARAGAPPSGSDWRISPDGIEAAKKRAEDFLRTLGESAAKSASGRKQSTLKDVDMNPPSAPTM